MRPNRNKFSQSLSRELDARADQVRSLIGDKHWGADGHHKEALVRGLVCSAMPSSVVVSRGFGIARGSDQAASTEQDVLVVDCRHEAPVFLHDGLVVSFPEPILASISVKTRYRKEEFVDSVKGVVELARLRMIGDSMPWAGAYFFNPKPATMTDGSPQEHADLIARWCAELGQDIAAVQQWCFRLSNDLLAYITPSAEGVRVAHATDASTAIFIARLVDSVSEGRGGGRSSFAQLVDDANDEVTVAQARW